MATPDYMLLAGISGRIDYECVVLSRAFLASRTVLPSSGGTARVFVSPPYAALRLLPCCRSPGAMRNLRRLTFRRDNDNHSLTC